MKMKMKSFVLSVLCLMGFLSHVQALEVGDYAPCIVLTGIQVDGQEAASCIREGGKRFTILKFFSALCSSCHIVHEKFVNLLASSPELLDKAAIHYIGIDSDKALLRHYRSRNATELEEWNATVFLDSERDAKRAYDVISTPTLFILDLQKDERSQNYKIVYKHRGIMDSQDIREFVDSIE